MHLAILATINKNIMITRIYHWRTEMNISLKMELFIKVNGRERFDMVLVYKFGPMEHVMRVIGKTIKLMELANFGM